MEIFSNEQLNLTDLHERCSKKLDNPSKSEVDKWKINNKELGI